MFLQRKLRAKFIGNEDYRPKNFDQKGYVPVVGFETRKVKKTFEGQEKVIDEPFLLIIDDHSKLIPVAAFNFNIQIDGADDNMAQATALLQNATILLKAIAEGGTKKNEAGKG